MKDITIFENFINDEELEEVRQFIGDESLNLNGKYYGEKQPAINRQWYFIPVDNAYKKILIDFRPTRDWAFDMENLVPSAKNFILKIKINLVSYLGKPRNISKLISENNIVQLNENTFEIFIPIKSFKNFSSLNWSKMKELRFSILESSNSKIVDFKLIEFRGDPDNPTKWFKQ